MNRITREQAFMLTAEVWARRSTCMRRNIGAVIVVNNHIIAVGYNGAAPGEPHCDGLTCIPPGMLGCSRTLHAETNAIDRVPSDHIITPKIMFCTESPCIACAAKIMDGPVRNFTAFYYLNEYRVDTGIKNLIMHKINVYRMTPSGFICRKSIDKCGNLTEELVS